MTTDQLSGQLFAILTMFFNKKPNHYPSCAPCLQHSLQHEAYWNVMLFCGDGTLALNRLTVGLIFPQLQDEISVICPVIKAMFTLLSTACSQFLPLSSHDFCSVASSCLLSTASVCTMDRDHCSNSLLPGLHCRGHFRADRQHPEPHCVAGHHLPGGLGA